MEASKQAGSKRREEAEQQANKAAQQFANQQRHAQEAGQSLMQESVRVYVDFVNSMFSSCQGSGTAEESTREDDRSIIRESARRSEGG